MEVDWAVLDAHEQIDNYSCIPSAVEMILKLEGLMPVGDYTEQEKWKNSKNGTFSAYHGVTIDNLKFKHEFAFKRDSNFPLDDLFARISEEISDGRFVVISLEMRPREYHMFVIYREEGGEFLAFSKSGRETIPTEQVKAKIRGMDGTDILTYSKVA